MKKMLVILLILFTKVLADSDEGKYVDLLPDEEKQQFLENVARRILKDVESKENVTGAQSGEVSDDQLKQHNEYVKSIIKEEQRSVNNEGDVNDQKSASASASASASEEGEVLSVQPLGTENTSLQEERVSNESSSNNITVEDVADNASIIKRSIEEDNASKNVQTGETSETLQKVSQKNITSEETNELEAENEKFEKENSAPDAKNSFDKVLETTESTTAGHKVDKTVSVQSNQTDDAPNVSVKAIHESRRTNNEVGKSVENTTDIDTTTSTVEVVKSTETKPDEYTDVSGTKEELTNLTYPFESSSLKGNTNESTTLDGILFENTTELTKKENNSESLLKSKNDTTKDSENELLTKITKSSRTIVNEETTESVPKTTEPVPETTESVTETTKPVTETTKSVTETTKPVTKITKSVIETSEPVPESTESVTETTKPPTATKTSVTETREFVPGPKTESEMVTAEAPTKSASTLFSSQRIPVATTEKNKIIVVDLSSAPTPATTVKSTILEPRTTTEKENIVSNERIVLSEEITSAAIESDKESHEESVETTTKKRIKHKVIVHKPVKYIVGPKAKKMAEAKNNGAQIDNFIELEKVYYDKSLKHEVGKEYHVFEIPADQSPFTKEEAPVADQPYYVPVYNYAPKNAYFNPQNRLGPNADDSSAVKNAIQSIFNNDDDSNLDKTETLNVKMEYDKIYDNKRKKFGSKQKTHGIHRPPIQNTETKKSHGKVNPDDYLDSDYYFGRVRKAKVRKFDLGKFPNSDEADHPAHSIREGSLKNHVRAVRNILFRQKSFGLLEKDKYGDNVEPILRNGRQRHVQNVSRKGSINNHIQLVGYLRKKNQTKKLYVIDDFFKTNVEKFIELQEITRDPPHIQNERNEVVAFLRKHDKTINNDRIVKKDITDFKESMKATSDQDDTLVNLNEDKVTKNLKLSLTKNEVLQVSVYLQVLKDMVASDNKALVQFDWLGTTVDIQAALQKLFELNALVANGEEVHPSDLEISKYVLFLYKLASEIIEANKLGVQLKKKLALPKNKKKLKPTMLKEKGLINRVWLYLRKEVPEVNEYKALKRLNSFYIDVEDGLYNLHDAIKNVAKITKYKNQHWYQNLKDLYISTDEKHLLQLLLHMTALRLFTLIEESAKNGLEEDYIQYMKKNRQHSKRTLEEMLFIMEILEKYHKYVK